jgi:uncharacterized protein YjiS (DUF1127 family)
MTLITLPRPFSFADLCRYEASHVAKNWASRFSKWRRRARSRRELRQLSEIDLQDIGWSRTDAIAESVKPFWQE